MTINNHSKIATTGTGNMSMKEDGNAKYLKDKSKQTRNLYRRMIPYLLAHNYKSASRCLYGLLSSQKKIANRVLRYNETGNAKENPVKHSSFF